VIDENPLVRLSVASVELPNGTLFDQYVMRFAPGAMTVVLDSAGFSPAPRRPAPPPGFP
jgi:hypothetical protein